MSDPGAWTLLRRGGRRRQTLASFDFQWRHLPAGDAMLSDPWFDAHVVEILPQITGIEASWFRGRRVLDAGCGGGRWTVGLLRLGAEVTAVDFSPAGLANTRAAAAELGPLETLQVDLLHLPEELASRRFDLVFSFGVLHHTGDTATALRNVAGLVADDGLLFLYLYGAGSWSLGQKLRTNWRRFRLAGLPFERKIAALARYDPDKDPHQAFDLLSPTINERLSFDTVERLLARLGFPSVRRTVGSEEIYLLAQRPGFDKSAALTSGPPLPSPLNARYDELHRLRRQLGAERRAWDLAADLLGEGDVVRPLSASLVRLGLTDEDLARRQVLLLCPDSLAPAREASAAGAAVTCLTPSGRWAAAAEAAGPKLPRVLVASPLAEVAPEDRGTVDLVVALGSAIALSRQPDRALSQLSRRLAPDGELILDALLPAAETWRHRLRRLSLRPLEFERQIAVLLRRHPAAGLEGAYAAWSARQPARFSPAALRALLAEGGFEVLAETQDDGRITMRARRCPA